MVGTIGPVVRGARRQASGLAAFLLAGIVSGAAIGAVAAGVGTVIPQVAAAATLLGVALLYGVGYAWSGRVVHVPGAPQAPSRWIDHQRPVAMAARYGAVMGAGIATPIRAGTVLSALVLASLTRNVALAAAAFALMATMRHLPVILIDLVAPRAAGRAETILTMTQKRWLVEAADVACLLVVSGAVLWHYPLVG